jgi:phage N-6-adenine-methyltransferase
MSTGPSIKRHRSSGDYATPWAFIAAVEHKFGPLRVDLAASPGNAKAPFYYTEAFNSLEQPWHDLMGNLWINPPFGDIKPWAMKCAAEAQSGAKILLLVPASVGANWFGDYVHNRAQVHFLSPRLSFDGKNAYPKDLIIAAYGWPPGYEVWKWSEDVPI